MTNSNEHTKDPSVMSAYSCRHCQNELSFIQHARSVYCESAICQRAKVQQYLEDNKQRLKTQLIAECEPYIPKVDVQNTSSPSNKELESNPATVALLPANTRQLTDLSEQRKQAFLQHLSLIYQDIQENKPKANKVYNELIHPPLEKDEGQLLGNACATCMGYCCRLGQTHAFVDYPSLKHMLDAQPDELSEQTLIDLYSDYLPFKSYQDACVFQGSQGCVLPRELRSFTCNNYLCTDLLSYRKNIKQAGSSVTFAAAVEKDKIMFSSVYDDKNFIRVREK